MAQQTMQTSGSISFADLNTKLNGYSNLGYYYQGVGISRFVENTSTRDPVGTGFSKIYTTNQYGANDRVWAWDYPDGYPSNLGPVFIIWGGLSWFWNYYINKDVVSSLYFQWPIADRTLARTNFVFFRGSYFGDNFTAAGLIGYNKYPKAYGIAANVITHREPATNAAVPTSGAISLGNLYGVVSYVL